MKKQILIFILISCISATYSQSYTIKGSITSSGNKRTTILPNTSIADPHEKIENFVENKNPVRVYKTSLQPKLITIGPGTLVLPVKEYNSYTKEITTSTPIYKVKTIPQPQPTQQSIVKKVEEQKPVTNNGFKSLTEPTSLVAKSETPTSTENFDTRSLTDITTPLNNASTQLTNLEPLTAYTSGFKEMETIDPALMKQPQLTALTNGTEKKINGRSLIELAPIEGSSTKQTNKKFDDFLTELAPIEGGINKSINQKGLPELAPIEMGVMKSTNQNFIPELAPIETENQQKNSNSLKGLSIPTGTKLSSEKGSSYIFKPITIVDKKDNISSDYIPFRNKPSAGGGFILPELAPIEAKMSTKKDIIPELAPIEKMEVSKEILIPELAPLPKENNNFEIGIPALAPIGEDHYQQSLQTNVSKKDVPCVHVHEVKCPCYHPPTAKKTYSPKKTTYFTRKKKTSPKVIYVYRDAQKTTQTNERIVYVPQQQATEYKQEGQQKQPMVLYRDYTNVYNKQTQQSSNASITKPSNIQDAQKYYNQGNYAQGLTAGPTSGDYPMTSSNYDATMKYTFHVGDRGKYGVSVYNDQVYIMLSQNGKVIEYRSTIEGSGGRPKVNFFGAPTNVAGIPIEYNYNRSVSKIGNVRFEYDFEGFFKKVSNSNVFYTTKSSLSNVDNVYVRYDGSGNVSSVDPNYGLVQLNNPQ